MNNIEKRFLLFIGGCILVRGLLVVVAKRTQRKNLPILGYLALIPAIGFTYIYLTDSRKTKSKTQDTIALEKEISNALGLKVTINRSSSNDASGTISIKYKSLDQLDVVLKKINPVD